MSEKETFEYLTINGYTVASITHPEFSKEVCLRHLNADNKHSKDFKEYFTEYINFNFK